MADNKTPDGGMAFPQLDVVAGERDGHGDPIEAFVQARGGITARDYFAIRAPLYQLIAFDEQISIEGIAAIAYEYADAMLAERVKAEGSAK